MVEIRSLIPENITKTLENERKEFQLNKQTLEKQVKDSFQVQDFAEKELKGMRQKAETLKEQANRHVGSLVNLRKMISIKH